LAATAAWRAPAAASHELHLSTRIGVTVYPLDDHDAHTLLRNADLVMYHAKQEAEIPHQLRPDRQGRTAGVSSFIPRARHIR
jgi:GGDEF domain-containing protein